MLSTNTFNETLKRVMACCELTEECQNDIQCLIDNNAECVGYLAQCGTMEDSEEGNTTFTPNEPTIVDDGYKEKYENLHQQYVDRFFGGGEPTEPPTEPPADPPTEPNENIEIKDLFK